MKEDFEIECARMVDRIVHDLPIQEQLGYLRVWVTILSNIQTHPDDSKYRVLKHRNKVISTRLLAVPGTIDLFNLLGVIKKVVDFEQAFSFDSVDSLLSEALSVFKSAQKRIEFLSVKPSVPKPKDQENERREIALLQIKQDRLDRKERLEREQQGRARLELKREREKSQKIEQALALRSKISTDRVQLKPFDRPFEPFKPFESVEAERDDGDDEMEPVDSE